MYLSFTKRLLNVLVIIAFLALPAFAQEEWRAAYEVGDPIEYYINEGMWQKGVVSENLPSGNMRVNHEEFVLGDYRRAGGVYIIYGKNDLRPAVASKTATENGDRTTFRSPDQRAIELPTAPIATSSRNATPSAPSVAMNGSGSAVITGTE